MGFILCKQRYSIWTKSLKSEYGLLVYGKLVLYNDRDHYIKIV